MGAGEPVCSVVLHSSLGSVAPVSWQLCRVTLVDTLKHIGLAEHLCSERLQEFQLLAFESA